jgi:hypothetical protein
VLLSTPSLVERLWAAAVAVASWGGAHAAELGLGLLLAVVVYWRRRELRDAAAVLLWRWFPGRTRQECVRRALALLQHRGGAAGLPRRRFQTVPMWLRSVLPPHAHGVDTLTAMAEWTAYSDLEPPWPDDEVRTVCRGAVAAWTLARWRKIALANRNGA